MPIEPFEIVKLVIGLIIITIPGYLWSFIFSKKLTKLERIVFGFVSGIGVLTSVSYLLTIFLKVELTPTFIYIIYAIYILPVIILYLLSIYRFGLPKVDIKKYKEIFDWKSPNIKYIFLAMILIFTFIMMFLPHLVNDYYLPFHVDEWIHWSYTESVIDSGFTVFVNPYTGTGTTANPEIGFHISTTCIKWMSGSSLLTIFLFMPAIIGTIISLTAFNIGERSNRKFGLEAAFFIAFIPTTARYLGPKFYVAVALGLLLLIFFIWLIQQNEIQGALVLSPLISFTFIVHPVTALACIILVVTYSMFLIFEKKFKIGLLNFLFLFLPIVIILLMSTRWDFLIEKFFEALSGKEYLLKLPDIWISFEHMGLITWGIFILGAYFSYTRGKSLKRSLSVSAIVFIFLIGLYNIWGYGYPIIYERTFLYLFIPVALIAGVGLSEIRRSLNDFLDSNRFKKYKKVTKFVKPTVPITICIVVLLIGVPAHVNTPYYKMINEKEYETFIWINENIDSYRDENHTYKQAVCHPFFASPFSAITGLYIVSSKMHPLIRYSTHTKVEKFLRDKCTDTAFLERYKISVIYGECNNDNLTKIYENVYIYPNLTKT